jgi:hypothetical protein
VSKSLVIWLDSVDARSMVRYLHTRDNTNVVKNVNIYPCTSGIKKQDNSVSDVGGDLHFRSFRIVISMKLIT